MAEEELQEQEATEEKSKKYITTTLDLNEDSDLIKKYTRIVKIGGFGNRDILEAGITALVGSDEYKEALKAIKEELGE